MRIAVAALALMLTTSLVHATCETDPAHVSKPLTQSAVTFLNDFFRTQCTRAHGALVDANDPALEGRLQPPSEPSLPGERDYYPTAAKRAGIQGRAELAIIVERDGKIGAVSVIASSGYKMLDDAALKLWKDARYRVPALLDGAQVRVLMYFSVNFRLTE
jgi:TonB family protein